MADALVGVVMGSKSDWSTMSNTVSTLESLGIACEARVMSAHRTPERVAEFVSNAEANGFGVIICGAGKAAHLAGAAAAHTTLPVIGVPIAAGTMPAATAAPDPEDEPPGVRAGS